MPSRALVTGSTGFIGSALCRHLIERGHRVRALHRRSSSLEAIEGLPLDRAVGDIMRPETLEPAMREIDWVFHAAAEAAHWRNPERVAHVNIRGTRNVARAAVAAGAKRLIYTSSIAALGLPPEDRPLTEDDKFNLDPERFPYGHAKHQAERAAREESGGDLELVTLNPSIVLGAGDINQISGTLVIESARGHIPFYPVGGANFVHIEDVAAGHLAAAERGRPGERYILGGENLTYQQLLTTLAAVTGSAPPRVRIPPWLSGPAAWLTALYARLVGVHVDPNLIRLSRYHIYCDRSKAARELGLVEVRPFRQAAREAYEWYREQGILE